MLLLLLLLLLKLKLKLKLLLLFFLQLLLTREFKIDRYIIYKHNIVWNRARAAQLGLHPRSRRSRRRILRI